VRGWRRATTRQATVLERDRAGDPLVEGLIFGGESVALSG
jgi:hypothetical protein